MCTEATQEKPIKLTREQADALCTVITLGFIIESKKPNPHNSYIIFQESRAQGNPATVDEHHLLQAKLAKLAKLADPSALFKFKTQYGTDKPEQPIIMAQTRKSPVQNDFTANERKIFQDLENEINSADSELPLRGAYVGGLVTVSGTKLLDPSILYWYTPEHRSLPNTEAERSSSQEGQGKKLLTEEDKAVFVSTTVKKFIDSKLANRVMKYGDASVSQEPERVGSDVVLRRPNKGGYLFASVHGMTQSIIQYRRNYDTNNVCIELALGRDTCKVASCIPCSIFMWSNNTPATATHFGRGDNWNFPTEDFEKMRRSPTAALPEHVTNWMRHVRLAYNVGKEYFPTKRSSEEQSFWPSEDLLFVLNKLDIEEVPQLFLEALTFEGSFLDKILSTLENMPME